MPMPEWGHRIALKKAGCRVTRSAPDGMGTWSATRLVTRNKGVRHISSDYCYVLLFHKIMFAITFLLRLSYASVDA